MFALIKKVVYVWMLVSGSFDHFRHGASGGFIFHQNQTSETPTTSVLYPGILLSMVSYFKLKCITTNKSQQIDPSQVWYSLYPTSS